MMLPRAMSCRHNKPYEAGGLLPLLRDCLVWVEGRVCCVFPEDALLDVLPLKAQSK